MQNATFYSEFICFFCVVTLFVVLVARKAANQLEEDIVCCFLVAFWCSVISAVIRLIESHWEC